MLYASFLSVVKMLLLLSPNTYSPVNAYDNNNKITFKLCSTDQEGLLLNVLLNQHNENTLYNEGISAIFFQYCKENIVDCQKNRNLHEEQVLFIFDKHLSSFKKNMTPLESFNLFSDEAQRYFANLLYYIILHQLHPNNITHSKNMPRFLEIIHQFDIESLPIFIKRIVNKHVFTDTDVIKLSQNTENFIINKKNNITYFKTLLINIQQLIVPRNIQEQICNECINKHIDTHYLYINTINSIENIIELSYSTIDTAAIFKLLNLINILHCNLIETHTNKVFDNVYYDKHVTFCIKQLLSIFYALYNQQLLIFEQKEYTQQYNEEFFMRIKFNACLQQELLKLKGISQYSNNTYEENNDTALYEKAITNVEEGFTQQLVNLQDIRNKRQKVNEINIEKYKNIKKKLLENLLKYFKRKRIVERNEDLTELVYQYISEHATIQSDNSNNSIEKIFLDYIQKEEVILQQKAEERAKKEEKKLKK